MKTVASWVKSAFVKIVDPEREDRVKRLVGALKRDLQTKQREFSLTETVQRIEHSESDLEFAKRRVFHDLLTKYWDDEYLTDRERTTLDWVASSLKLSSVKVRELNFQFAIERFAAALADAMQDGVLETNEEARLQRIAESVGSTMSQFTQQLFREEGEAFLRGLFLARVEDGQFSEREWQHLLETTRKLGISRSELLDCIRP